MAMNRSEISARALPLQISAGFLWFLALVLVSVMLIFPMKFVDVAALLVFVGVLVPQFVKWQGQRQSRMQGA